MQLFENHAGSSIDRNSPLAMFHSIRMGKEKMVERCGIFPSQSERDSQVKLSAVMESFESFIWKLEEEEGPNALLRYVYTEGLD